jgi:ABC-type nitrate/sulfonate/bicarbonate transport system substrate-binding protein
MSPFYTAWESGYFTAAGFDVKLTRELPNLESIPLLAAGRLDVGFPGLSAALLNAVARGAAIRIVAGREISSPACNMHDKIYVRRGDFPHGIADLRPLRHRTIAFRSGSSLAPFSLDKLLEHAGMNRTDIEVHPMGTSEAVAALRAKGVDAILSSSADGDLSLRLDALQLAPGPSLADVLPGFQYSFIVFGKRLLEGDVHAGARFLRAYLRGAREFLAGKTPRFMDEYAKSNSLDPKIIRGGCRDSFDHDGRTHLTDLQMYADWAASRGYIEHPIDAGSLVDTRFLDAMEGMV